MAFPADYSILDTDITDATSTDNADLGKDHATAHNEVHAALNDLATQATADEAYGSAWNGKLEFPTKNAVYDKIETLVTTPAALTTYTPTWASDGTQPAIGNGTLTGAYMVIGKMAFVRASMKSGTTTTYGTGAYSLSLPAGVVAKTTTSIRQVLAAWLFDSSAGTVYPATSYLSSAATAMFFAVVGGTGFVAATNPFTWASGDEIQVSGWFEIN